MAGVPMMATGYRRIARRYSRGENRRYGCPSESQNELIASAAPGMNRTSRGLRLSNGRFDHVCPGHRGEREAVTASNSVTTCVVLGGGRIRVPGVRRRQRGITALPGLSGQVQLRPDNPHLVVHGLHRRPAGDAVAVRLGV